MFVLLTYEPLWFPFIVKLLRGLGRVSSPSLDNSLQISPPPKEKNNKISFLSCWKLKLKNDLSTSPTPPFLQVSLEALGAYPRKIIKKVFEIFPHKKAPKTKAQFLSLSQVSFLLSVLVSYQGPIVLKSHDENTFL